MCISLLSESRKTLQLTKQVHQADRSQWLFRPFVVALVMGRGLGLRRWADGDPILRKTRDLLAVLLRRGGSAFMRFSLVQRGAALNRVDRRGVTSTPLSAGTRQTLEPWRKASRGLLVIGKNKQRIRFRICSDSSGQRPGLAAAHPLHEKGGARKWPIRPAGTVPCHNRTRRWRSPQELPESTGS